MQIVTFKWASTFLFLLYEKYMVGTSENKLKGVKADDVLAPLMYVYWKTSFQIVLAKLIVIVCSLCHENYKHSSCQLICSSQDKLCLFVLQHNFYGGIHLLNKENIGTQLSYCFTDNAIPYSNYCCLSPFWNVGGFLHDCMNLDICQYVCLLIHKQVLYVLLVFLI